MSYVSRIRNKQDVFFKNYLIFWSIIDVSIALQNLFSILQYLTTWIMFIELPWNYFIKFLQK